MVPALHSRLRDRGPRALIGVSVWAVAGAVIAELLTLIMSTSSAYAAAGIALVVGSVAWTLGPTKAPMVWAEGALSTYQGNAEGKPSNAPPRRRRVIAVPAFALIAGALLLVIAGVAATH